MHPYKRAIMPLWINAIEKALNDTLKCPKCEMSYYDSFVEFCPFCDEVKPLRVEVKSHKARFVCELDSKIAIEVPLSLIEEISLDKNKQGILFQIKRYKNDVILENKCGKKLLINEREVYSKYKRPIKEFYNMTIKIDTCELDLKILGNN